MSDTPDVKLHNVSGNQQPGGANNHSTPIQSKKPIAPTQDVNDAFSPFFSQYTQEENENTVDVIWDWYSPQSKPRVRKINKFKSDQQSPKLPIKRQPSNNQIDGFNKLRGELETLRDQIVESTEATKHNNNEVNNTFNTCNSSTKSDVKTNCFKDNMNKIADDSFDFILETLKDEDLEFNEPFIVADERARETNCDNIQNKDQFTAKASQSIHAQDNSLKCTAEEIEKKRKEALLKLEVKKKQIACEVPVPKCATQETEQIRKEAFTKLQVKQKEVAYESDSPIKCSPEEIEQKRLQAIAKLEAKKKQDIIERNRQEALRRLEENKRKRALLGQTSLPRKIHNANI